MNEIQELSDLRPAPGTTSTTALWMMLAVVCGGAAMLIWLPQDTEPGATAATARSLDHAQVAPAKAGVNEVATSSGQ